MPELPEVETVRLELLHHLQLPLRLKNLKLHRGDLRNRFDKKMLRSFEGQSLQKISRRSKYLLFYFGQGGILSHLGMTGHWRIEKVGAFQLGKHDHIQLDFESGQSLIYNDPRRFGFFDGFREVSDHRLLKEIGPEPLEDSFTGQVLHQRLKNRSGPIKSILMNQSIVAGVGNIYASEVLFSSRIRPSRPALRLKLADCERIVLELKLILQQSIKLGGSSFDDFRHVSGEKGEFQNQFKVYNQAGNPCQKCGSTIKKQNFSGRSTFWCGQCQK